MLKIVNVMITTRCYFWYLFQLSQGIDTVKTAILNHFLSHRDQQVALYSLPPSLLKVAKLIRQEVCAHGIWPVVESQSEDVACPSLFENIKNASPKYLTGEMFLRLVETMYHKVGGVYCRVYTDNGHLYCRCLILEL